MAAFGAFERLSESTSCCRAVGMMISHCDSKLNHRDSVNQQLRQQQSTAVTATINDQNGNNQWPKWQQSTAINAHDRNDSITNDAIVTATMRDSTNLNNQQTTTVTAKYQSLRQQNQRPQQQNQGPKRQQPPTQTSAINDQNSNNQRPKQQRQQHQQQRWKGGAKPVTPQVGFF